MQLLTAIMQPFLVDRATRALRAENIAQYTLTKIVGAHKELLENQVQHAKEMIKLELPVHDADAARIIDLIRQATTHHEVSDTVIWTVSMLVYESGES